MSSLLPAPAASSSSAVPRWSRWFGIFSCLAVAGLLIWAAGRVDWPAVLQALRGMPVGVLLLAALLAAFSHGVYSTYDLIGRAWVGHRLSWFRVVQTTFVSYAFNLNLGMLVGGLAMRFRLYARLGLRAGLTSRIVGLSIVTNWLGYGLLAGAVFLFRQLPPPPDWAFSMDALQAVGAALWLLVAGYLALCAWAPGRRLRVRGHDIHVPSWRMAVLQLALSCINWLLIGATLFVLLQGTAPYGKVLAVSLVAAVAGVIARLPAGLGVMEAVFVALLAPLAEPQVLAAVLAYRALYYLLPLLAATGTYLTLEARRPPPSLAQQQSTEPRPERRHS